MICPICDSDENFVVDTRESVLSETESIVIRRRRKCSRCGLRFTTMELRTEDLELNKSHVMKLERELKAHRNLFKLPKSDTDGFVRVAISILEALGKIEEQKDG